MPVEATLVFEGDLDHFLPVRDRAGPLRHVLVEPASAKDIIESHGVPHPEVDGIRCDGEWVGFGHHVQGGETICVLPYAYREQIPVPARLVPDPPVEVRFVLDGHLGTLARHLRLLGFHALWWPDPADAILAGISAGELRILLTRDVGLLKRRVIVLGHKLRTERPFDQAVEILRRYELTSRIAPFRRCLACNGLTENVAKNEIIDRLEPGTRREHDEFRRCAGCGRIYWRGTHYPRLVALVSELRAAVAGAA